MIDILCRLARLNTRLFYYIVAHVVLLFKYDRKILSSRHFNNGRLCGICSIGWKWVVKDAFGCRRLGVNCNVPWPVSPLIVVGSPENIIFHPDNLDNFQQFGNYFQAYGKIVIGHGTYIAPNVGIITANHSLYDPEEHVLPQSVVLGEKCWIGMNSVILPGVTLGNHTTVGAGSVVTHSFPEGDCVIAGNPARIIKKLCDEDMNNAQMLGNIVHAS